MTRDDGWDYHEHMLCPECARYEKKGAMGCHIATELLAFNLKHDVSAAIFECSHFKERNNAKNPDL